MMTTAGLQTCHAHIDTENDVIDYLTTYRIYNQNFTNDNENKNENENESDNEKKKIKNGKNKMSKSNSNIYCNSHEIGNKN